MIIAPIHEVNHCHGAAPGHPCEGGEGLPSHASEIEDWIARRSEAHGGRNKFLTSDEYRQAYPALQKLHKSAQGDYIAKGQEALKAVGQMVGDRVFYDHVTPFGVEKYSGMIVNRKGLPFVKLDPSQEMLGGKKSTKWHKGWRKL